MPYAIIDLNENKLFEFEYEILKILLTDKTTKSNIIWAVSDYRQLGSEYDFMNPITAELITGTHACVIQPRVAKEKQNQTDRTKDMAEVFTPAWMCNKQNNLIDGAWFGMPDVFNRAEFKTWTTNHAPIPFGDKKGSRWQDYVDARRMEMACGEAPYLTSRYDMFTGEYIEVPDRIGLLDRKLRVVSENTNEEEDWLKWAFRALESIYGFEYQGDSLLIARENILCTFIENMQYKFEKVPAKKALKRAANIIAWNIWQMDGLTFAVPYGISKQEELYCKIHDWRSKKTVKYCSLMKEKVD